MKPAKQVVREILNGRETALTEALGLYDPLVDRMIVTIEQEREQARREGAEDIRWRSAVCVEGFANEYDGTTEMKEAILNLPLVSDD